MVYPVCGREIKLAEDKAEHFYSYVIFSKLKLLDLSLHVHSKLPLLWMLYSAPFFHMISLVSHVKRGYRLPALSTREFLLRCVAISAHNARLWTSSHYHGRTSKFWTLYIGILYGPLPAFTAIHSSVFVGPPHMRALYTQSPLSPLSYAPAHYSVLEK